MKLEDGFTTKHNKESQCQWQQGEINKVKSI